MITSCLILLKIRNVSGKKCRENQNTNFYVQQRLRKSAVCEKMSINTVGPVRPQMTIRRMPIPCWIPKATNTH